MRGALKVGGRAPGFSAPNIHGDGDSVSVTCSGGALLFCRFTRGGW